MNNFNYVFPGIYGNYTNSSKWEVVAELDVNRIVILDGYATQTVTVKKKLFGLFKKTTTTLDNGHTWICDGYEITGDICNKYVMLWMSWGDHDGYRNGFFMNLTGFKEIQTTNTKRSFTNIFSHLNNK